MRVFNIAKRVSAEVPMSFFHFERFEKQCGDFVFIDARIDFRAIEGLKEKKIVYFEIEEPNRFSSSDLSFRREEHENDFYRFLCVCPYTTEWLNKIKGENRRQFVFFPFNENLIPAPAKKIYDVIYFGGIHSREILSVVKTISKFNYRFIAPSEERTYRVFFNLPVVFKITRLLLQYLPFLRSKEKFITNKDVPHLEKLKLISESKITIVHNLLSFNVRQAWNIQNTKGFKDNKAFALIPEKNILRSILHFFLQKEFIVPQQKTRLFEAAFCRSLILCRKDPFNTVERFFIPDKEFIYYENGKLEEKLKDVLAHYEDYQHIIENAFQRASREYTTQIFFEKFLKDIK